MAKTVTMKPQEKGQEAISFKEGGLHRATGTKSGAKISAKEHAEAASGKLGPKAEKQERFYENVLKHGKSNNTGTPKASHGTCPSCGRTSCNMGYH